MFKIIYRTFFILLIAGLVAGGLYAFFNTSAGQALIQNGRGGFDRGEQFNLGGGIIAANANTFFQPAPGGDFGGGHDFRGGAGSPLALLNLAKNAITIGLITLIVVLVQKSWKGISLFLRRKSQKAPAS